jgi:fibronectin type 3 domain-containing protein
LSGPPVRSSLVELESRVNPTSITQYHVDPISNGVNFNETVLTRQNVNSNTFGKLWQYQVAGQVYAEPLVLTGVNITTGPNQGMHTVVFVATEHDQLYALDAAWDPATQSISQELLWQRSFLSDSLNTNPGDLLAGNSGVTTVPQADVISSDITTEIGITGTPVIDPNNATIYLVAKTKETVGGTAHYVQRLYAVNIQNGTDKTAPLLLGDTTGTSTYTNYASETRNSSTAGSQIWVYGNGAGTNDRIVDPYFGTGRNIVSFNALREHQRPALNLANGVVYIGWASHGDNGPYHGWMVGVSAYSSGSPNLALKGVLCTTPNNGLGGIWMAGGALTFDSTYFYFETGNGGFDGSNGTGTGSDPTAPAPGPISGLDNSTFPINGDYSDSFVKVALDSTTVSTQHRTLGTATQTDHSNGWGMSIVDYFTPFNQAYLNATDKDVGSSACVVVPDYNPSGGPNQFASASLPRLLVGSGKEGVIYLINRDNMGKYGLTNTIVQNSANELSGSLDSASLYNGQMYYVEGYGGVAKTFRFANAAFATAPTSTSADPYSFAGSTPFISSNGATNGIVWDIDRGTNQLRAYSTDSYGTELYTSAQAPNGRDVMGAAVKFQVVTVANGRAFLGSGTGDPNDFLVVYGPLSPPTQAPAAPSGLGAQPVSSSQINLTWTDNSVGPNQAYGFDIEESPSGTSSWTQIATANGTSYSVGGLQASTTYYFRIRAYNSIGSSGYNTNGPVSATTTSQGNVINYPNGFSTYPNGGSLQFNGGAAISGNTVVLTDGNNNEARTVYASTQLTVSAFTTTYTYLMTGTQGTTADGITFVIQNQSATAVGGGGGSLGYAGITPSFAIAINVYSGHPFGSEFLTNGTVDGGYSETNINTSLVNVPITVTITYYGGNTLTATLTQGNNVDTKTYTFASNLATLIGSNAAWVGFTGATGAVNSTQKIMNWTFTQLSPPDQVSNLQATVTGFVGGSEQQVPLGAHLTWNAAAGAANYKIERKLTAGGTYSQIGTSNTTSFDDTSALTPGSTYFYRVRATNQVGDGAYSVEVQVNTPSLPPTPNGQQLAGVTTSSISFSWTNNASNADSYQIIRSVNGGTYSFLVMLPPQNSGVPNTMTYTDTGLSPGTNYSYHIEAYNKAGYSDFAGINTNTQPLAPTGLQGGAANAAINLTWTGPSGATSYNVYRGTSPGGEGAMPIATGVTSTNYTDSSVAYNTTYYYKVTAVSNATEGATSNEASQFFAGPPTLAIAPQINDGSAQRSEVRSITVTFLGPVTFTGGNAAAAFQLQQVQNSANVMLNAVVSVDSHNRTVVILTFANTNASTEVDPVSEQNGYASSPSLADGRYQLTIFGSHVLGANGIAFDGAGNGTAGSNYVSPTDTYLGTGGLHLYRLFGDVDGDGVVDPVDLNSFRTTFNSNNTQANFLAFLDANNDGVIDPTDLNQFRARFNTNVF